MEVRIRALVGGGEVTVECERDSTVAELKANALEALGVNESPANYKLALSGQVLGDEMATIEGIGIKDGDELKLLKSDTSVASSLSFFPLLSNKSQERTRRRIISEIRDAKKHSTIVLYADMVTLDGLKWEVIIKGRGRWNGRTYKTLLDIPANYPFMPPKLLFIDLPSGFMHVYPDKSFCFNRLWEGVWDPKSDTISAIFDVLELGFMTPGFNASR